MAKQLVHTSRQCGGFYFIEHNDKNIPYLVCDKCGNTISDWIKWEAEYKFFWQDEEKWKEKKHQLVCLLGHFSNLYNSHYGIDFAFSLNENGLFRGREINILRKILGNFDNNAIEVKKYISWIFKNKVSIKKKKITSLAFMAHPEVMNEYRFVLKKAGTIERNTRLPEKMLVWLKANAASVLENNSLSDFGDLHLYLSHYSKGSITASKEGDLFIFVLKKSGLVDENLMIKNFALNLV